MFNLDPGKLIVIAVVAIILLGPDKLPQVARQVGAAWRSFGEFRHRMESEVRSTLPDLPSTSEIARLARSPSALLNHLSSMSEDEDRAAPDVAGDAAAVPEADPGGGHDVGGNDGPGSGGSRFATPTAARAGRAGRPQSELTARPW